MPLTSALTLARDIARGARPCGWLGFYLSLRIATYRQSVDQSPRCDVLVYTCNQVYAAPVDTFFLLRAPRAARRPHLLVCMRRLQLYPRQPLKSPPPLHGRRVAGRRGGAHVVTLSARQRCASRLLSVTERSIHPVCKPPGAGIFETRTRVDFFQKRPIS